MYPIQSKIYMEFSQLSKSIYSYDFFQILHLFENYCLRKGINLEEKLSLQANYELVFPAVDLKEFFINERDEALLTINFMGLTGVDSPLPQYFFAELQRENATNKAIKNFLHIFNQRIYFLLYRAWKKYRLTSCQKQQQQFLFNLQMLSGNLLHQADKNEFTYAVQMGARIHPRYQLQYILQEFLQINYLEITEFIPTWKRLDKIAGLGTNLRLTDNTILGERCLLMNNHVRIIIKDIDPKDLEKILPYTDTGKTLQNLLQRYLPMWQKYSLLIQIKTAELSYLLLGQTYLKLGWNCWLGQAKSAYFTLAQAQFYN